MSRLGLTYFSFTYCIIPATCGSFNLLLSELPSWCKLACANAAGGADGRCTVLRTALSNLLQQLRWLDERVASVRLLRLYMLARRVRCGAVLAPPRPSRVALACMSKLKAKIVVISL